MCLDWSSKSWTAQTAQVRYNLEGRISWKHPAAEPELYGSKRISKNT